MNLSNQTICYNPANGEVIGHSQLHSIEDLPGIIKKARHAQKQWERETIKKRKKIILKIRDYLIDNMQELSETLSKDNGKTRSDALVTEILVSVIAANYFAKNAKYFLKPKKISAGSIITIYKRSVIHRVPFGVIGIISPWNYPLSIPFYEIIMGLLAGNAVILKASSDTQMIGRSLEKALKAANLPEGLFSYVNLPGRIAGDALLDLGIDKLFFTGSLQVGKKLVVKASESLTPISLELGGNDAMLVCKDADIDRAVYGALWGGFSNCGQSCGGIERIYVHKDVYEPFVNLLKKRVKKIRVGQDLDYNVDMGAMTAKSQIDIVNKHINDALEKGAAIFAQSDYPKQSNGNFLPATVLTNVNHDMLVMKDETFGPVVGVMSVDNMSKAIEYANDSYFGLSGSVWSKNEKNAHTIAKQIKAGSIMINDHLASHGMPETPWGGFKQSGIGRVHGSIGFDEMTQPQCIINDVLPFVKRNMWWHPYSEDLYEGIIGLMELLYKKNLFLRINGFFKAVKKIPRIFITDKSVQ